MSSPTTYGQRNRTNSSNYHKSLRYSIFNSVKDMVLVQSEPFQSEHDAVHKDNIFTQLWGLFSCYTCPLMAREMSL